MEIVNLLLGLLIGAIGVYVYLNAKLQGLRTEKIHLEVSLDEKIKSYENQIDLINIAKEQMSKDFKEVANDILEKDRVNLQTKNSELLTPLQSQLKDFKDRIESITSEQVKERATLAAQIENLKNTSIRGTRNYTKSYRSANLR